MKKTLIFVFSLIIIITFFLFCNITQANAQCNIIWWGEESGYSPTLEGEVTETATSEAFSAIFGLNPTKCVYNVPGFYCVNYDLDYVVYLGGNGIIPDPTWFPQANQPPSDFNGWDVVCSDQCEALGGDSDIDGICDDIDNCPGIQNHLQEDADSDGTGDVCAG
jgi:hypothetical protein